MVFTGFISTCAIYKTMPRIIAEQPLLYKHLTGPEARILRKRQPVHFLRSMQPVRLELALILDTTR